METAVFALQEGPMTEPKETWRGKVRGMTQAEVEDFLNLGVNMYLACLTPDGSPYITVCWHEWRDGNFWVIPRQHSRWAEYLAKDPRISFVVEQPKTLGKVLGSGHAELIERPNIGGEWVPIATRMSYRYLGENGPTYLESTMKQPRWLFRIKPESFETWQGVGWGAATGSRKPAGRRMRRPTPPSSPASARKRSVMLALAAREQELIEFARALVAAPSPNPPGDERQVADLARAEMERLGYAGTRTIAMDPARPNVVGVAFESSTEPTLMLNGHIDTKPAGDVAEWSPGPYDPVLRDGRLHGLGSADMKGAVAAMVYAGAALIEAGAPPGTLKIVLTADEEAGSRYGARFLAGRPELAADSVLVGEATGMEVPWAYVAVASRGLSCFLVKVRGTQMHSSLSDQVPSVNASVQLAKVLTRMAAGFKPTYPANPLVPGGPTVNLGVTLSGGVFFGVYPGHAEFGLDIRTLPGMTLAGLQADLAAFL